MEISKISDKKEQNEVKNVVSPNKAGDLKKEIKKSVEKAEIVEDDDNFDYNQLLMQEEEVEFDPQAAGIDWEEIHEQNSNELKQLDLNEESDPDSNALTKEDLQYKIKKFKPNPEEQM